MPRATIYIDFHFKKGVGRVQWWPSPLERTTETKSLEVDHPAPSASSPVPSGAARGSLTPTPEKTQMFCFLFELFPSFGAGVVGGGMDRKQADMVPGWLTLSTSATVIVEKAPRRDSFPSVVGVRPAKESKWAPFGATFLYLLEQMYSASFSALPQFSPSVSRPILFTGKQQKIRFFAWPLKPLCSCVVLLTFKQEGTSLTSHREICREGAGSWPLWVAMGDPPPSLNPTELVCKGGGHTHTGLF